MIIQELQRRSSDHRPTQHAPATEICVFTVRAGGETVGLPITSVHTIFRVIHVTPVPLAPPEVVGLINLRGKITTATSLRRRLGLEDTGTHIDALAIGIEHHAENFALIVDEIGDVLNVPDSAQIPEPPNVDPARSALTSAVYRLDAGILPVLDLEALFSFNRSRKSAA